MKAKTPKYLRLKGNTYQFQYWVKDALKHHPMFCGKKVYIKSLGTGDIRIAKVRRDQLLREIESLLEGSKAAEFRAHVQKLREINSQFIKDNPSYGDGWYSLGYEEIEREALKRGVKLTDDGHLPPDLPEDLKMRLVALSHAREETTMGETLAPPTPYHDTLRDLQKRTVKIKEQMGKRTRTIRKYKRSVDAFLDYLGVRDIPINGIRRKQVAEFSTTMQTQYAGSTVGNFLSFLSEIWKVARDSEIVDGDNPFVGHRIKDDTKSYEVWTDEQLKDLYKLLPEEDRLPFKIGVYTGARQDEILTIKPEDVKEIETDTGSKILCLHIKPQGDGKTKSSTRLIPVHKALIDDLKNFNGFSSSSSAYSKRFGRVKRKYLGDGDSRDLCFHSIRHVLSTALHRAGVDSLIIDYITGHSTPGASESVRTYIHGPSIRQMQDALDKLRVIV